MKILVIGGGGREHSIIWKLSLNKKVKKIYCAPGNAGISELAECLNIKVNEFDKIKDFAIKEKISLVVIGPEEPLSLGLVDELEKAGIRAFGPSKKAAELEGSKDFAKKIMQKYNIPTATSKSFTSFEKAKTYLKKQSFPIVIKADGLAAGKGVLICSDENEAINGLEKIMVQKAFGNAGNKVVVEEFLNGEEASFIALTDGKTILPFPTSQDHKRVFDDDKGLNTGGMGAYSPAPIMTDSLIKKAIDEVMIPAVNGMRKEGIPFKGVLYAGLMIKGNEIKVLEFNVRFGDPEAQPLLLRLKSDLLGLLESCIDGTLHKHKLEITNNPAVCVVMASKGYPEDYKKGIEIQGLDQIKNNNNAYVFHSGTIQDKNKILTNGGRVLGITALGSNIENAIKNAYKIVEKISWNGAHYRKDIGRKALLKIQKNPLVSVIMGSSSDLPIMERTLEKLNYFNIPYETIVASAHRNPKKVADFASTAKKRGIKVIIAGAGFAAHLAGVIAAHTTLPVIGVPIDSSSLNGLDSLLAMVQMPSSVPVATLTIGKAGASNAGILAAQIIALSNEDLAKKLEHFKKQLENS